MSQTRLNTSGKHSQNAPLDSLDLSWHRLALRAFILTTLTYGVVLAITVLIMGPQVTVISVWTLWFALGVMTILLAACSLSSPDLSRGSVGAKVQRAIKRLLDVVLASIALGAVLPIFPLVALAIRLESRGPVLFRLTRIGYAGRLFEVYKFRTLASRDGELAPRVTRVGRVLRVTSLDGLPMLINVVVGDMSLVGPWPRLPFISAAMAAQERPDEVLSVRPGLVGLAQLSARAGLDADRWAALDREYVRKWSLLLDLKILLSTPWAVLRGGGL